MKAVQISLVVAAFTALLPATPSLRAADEAPAFARPGERPEMRRPFRDLSPDEQETRFKEMQERFGPPPFTLDELRQMPPQERQPALRKWREKGLEERQRRRLKIRERLTRQIAELKARKKLSEEERLRLERLELIASRFDRISRLPMNTFGAPPNDAAPPTKPK